MPTHAVPVADERSAIIAFLGQQQDAFRSVAYGLTDDQAGTRSVPSSELTVGTLVKHATQAQQNWLTTALSAPERRRDDRSEAERFAEHQDGFTWHETDTLAEVLAAYDEVSAAVLDAVATLDLDTAVPVPEAPWFPKDVAAWSVRWVWFHLIEELARHAGHADILREALDGATMYELVAGREGWPATPWLTPWQPPVPA
ncbi:DinB family protein [Nocardioides sp.]|jgi:hypothetical protein|uniref:DinB family protein n=1 Tax=Nocardioides sp. TaxID=35761 RepID=UPI002CA4016E|nr:DinB family protein [Nocardioides sp.]HVX55375.1 DinB family protein [Nocardioides sp.]